MTDQEREEDYQTSVAALGLSRETLTRLQEANMHTIGHLATWLADDRRQPVRGISSATLEGLRQSLEAYRQRTRERADAEGSTA